MHDEISKVVRSTIKQMILDGDIRLEEITEDTISNEGFNYGKETLYVLSVDGEKQSVFDGLSVDRPEITGY